MDQLWIKIIFYLAFVCYTLPIYNYTTWLIENITTKRNDRIISNLLMLAALILLSINSGYHAIKTEKAKKIELYDIEYVTTFPANIGYILYAVNSAYLVYLYYNKDKSYYYYLYFVAIVSNLLLAAKNNLGLYLSFFFYLISVFHMHNTETDRIGLVTKYGLLFYFGTYVYRHFMQSIKNKQFKFYPNSTGDTKEQDKH